MCNQIALSPEKTFTMILSFFISILLYKYLLVISVDLTAERQNLQEIRNDCIWKLRKTTKVQGNQVIQDCILSNVNFKEGSDVLHFTRIGPFTTRGGAEPITIKIPKIPPPDNNLLVLFTSVPIDPYTETVINYPPIHLHHAISRDPPDLKGMRASFYSSVSYLDDGVQRFNNYPRMASDYACFEDKGGSDCLLDRFS